MAPSRPRILLATLLLVGGGLLASFSACNTADYNRPLPVFDQRDDLLESVGGPRGIVAVIDWPGGDAQSVLDLLEDNRWRIYFQSDDQQQVDQVRAAAATAGTLGKRVFADIGSAAQIQLANNTADGILVGPTAEEKVAREELLRALRPQAIAFVGADKVVKPVPEGSDDWSHPYHGPDNNPQSQDTLARGELRTQFINRPKFSPMPEQTVAAGGRLFKAMGHIAHRKNQNAHLNTLVGINAYNGTLLWKISLPQGFMIHRNTMVATDDALYIGDHESCKVIDAATGKVLDEITVPAELTDGPVWKWMAIRDGTLYALVGNREVSISTQPSDQEGMGHWPWGMWEGHDYGDAKSSFGYGRSLIAIDLESKQPKWHVRTEDYIDARALVMNPDHVFLYSPQKMLMAVDRRSGEVAWKLDEGATLDALGPLEKAQHYTTGYSTTCYAKCNDDYLFFAGPQCSKMVVVSTKTGEVAWTHPDGNLQLVLRDDAIYAAGPKSTGVRLAYATGEKIGELPTRRACTRATGCADSVFYRAKGGTVRVLAASANREGVSDAHHIAAMRPPCQDGVLVAHGHLYWGPWMCGCELSLYGNIGVGFAGDQTLATDASLYETALTTHSDAEPEPLELAEHDWPAFRAGNERSDFVSVALPRAVEADWDLEVSTGVMPTAPVAGGEMVFVADRSGAVQALTAAGEPVWKSYVSGPVYFAPTLAEDRVFVGSADGRVYAFAARTGERLWSFRVAPVDERIHVFGELISRWPVAGGVAVQDGTLYAAAGIANYDGTYVVALDAKTGKLVAQNSTSGKLAPKVNGGISLQGNLSIVDGELRFLGGGVYETARYDLKTLECLNEPAETLEAGYRTAFYPLYPIYGKYVSMQASCSSGTLCYAASYEGNIFGNISLRAAPAEGESVPTGEIARRALRRSGKLPKGENLWRDNKNRRFTSFIVSDDLLIATGHTDKLPDQPFIVAINVADGSDVWRHYLPADTVKGGIAIDHQKRIFVSLENGQVHCFRPLEEPEA